MQNQLHILLLGATGFSGMRCIPYLHKLCKSSGRDLTWGVAGRSVEKLKEILKNAEQEIGTDLKDIPIVLVDIRDKKSLANMVRAAKVIINCCGPFRFLGEPVAKACIEAGTHHIDISAEPQFMEKIALELHDEAKERGVYLVTACGFDCIPSDLGTVFVQENFEGTLNSLNMYLEVWKQEGNKSKPLIGYNSNSFINFGTWESAVHCVANWQEIMQIRNKLFPEVMDKYEPEAKLKYLPHRPRIVQGWAVPFPTADSSAVKRSEKYFYEVDQKRPLKMNNYFIANSLFETFLLCIFVVLLYIFTRCKIGCHILLKYPAVFTLGAVRKSTPKSELIENSCYQATFYGEGWKEKVGINDVHYQKPCNTCVLARFKGRDAYDLTAYGVVLSAIVLLTETDKLPKQGGVFSAGACFAKTSLIKQLMEHGADFQILYQKDL